jgi:sulfatase-modifying factor enzyme 1
MKSPFSFFLIVSLLMIVFCNKSYSDDVVIDDTPQMIGEDENDLEALVVEPPCPADMVLVDGMYCPSVEEVCLYYVDIKGNKVPPGDTPQQTGRCGEFQFPSICLSENKIHKRFCIDKFEMPNVEGQIPQSWMTWYDVKKAAEAQGKRLCLKSEWVFACEGKDIKPYPYLDGYHRSNTACNTDKEIPAFDRFKDTKELRYMDKLLVPSGSMPDCHSDFGVFDQVGSLDEFVVNESGHPFQSSLVGGDSIGVRNRCRVSTDAHYEGFGWWETSGRGCKDAAY